MKPGAGGRVLVIDDEAVVCLSCVKILTAAGHAVEYRQQAAVGLEAARTGAFDVVLLDLMMPEMDGLEVLAALRQEGVTAEVVIITGYSTVETAVEAMKRGASDYVPKPFTPDELQLVVHKVMERSALLREVAALRQELETRRQFEGFIGESPAMARVFTVITRVAPSEGTVLITGESGTGKEMAARAIHHLSPRCSLPFVACDCSSLAPTLLESELFGHVRGSFSGAVATKQGLFELSHKGTLFLDEVANIGLETQSKLLRVLETRRVRRVGDTAEREVDIRLVAASNRDLAEMVKTGAFREDLYYRLNVVPLSLPPLRERAGDIPRLTVAFLERFRQTAAVRVEGFTPEAMRLLERYAWPGNVRELKNIVERLAILCDAARVAPPHLPAEIRAARPPRIAPRLPPTWDEFKDFKQRVRDATIADLDRQFLLEALQRAGGNVTRAAEAVGMQRTNFHALMRKLGLGGEPEE
ncbi:MAG TPA: sigma-54 dependent transcriptional regulator [Polyangia bacterium]|jgi:two-component system NtrC family response regulator